MGFLDLLVILLAYGGVTGVLFFFESKRLRSLMGQDREGTKAD